MVVAIAMVSLPTSVQLTPSADRYALMVLPLRVRRTQTGGAPSPPAVCAERLDVAGRRWNASPFVDPKGVTIMKACADPGVSDSRSMTPAFVHGSTFCSVAT